MLLQHYIAETCATPCSALFLHKKRLRRKGRSRSWYHPNSEGRSCRLPSEHRIGVRRRCLLLVQPRDLENDTS